MQIKLPSPWPEFLAAVDQRLSHRAELHCVGGFVLAVLYGIPRPTADIDYIGVNPESNEIDEMAGRESRLCRQYKLYFQRIGGIADFPECYEERLTELPLDLQKLVLKALDPYDLILSKLTRNSPKDSEDVKFLAKKLQLNFSTLYERWKKEMTFVPNAERHETTLKLWNSYFSE